MDMEGARRENVLCMLYRRGEKEIKRGAKRRSTRRRGQREGGLEEEDNGYGEGGLAKKERGVFQ